METAPTADNPEMTFCNQEAGRFDVALTIHL
jgi:hypothetical protein